MRRKKEYNKRGRKTGQLASEFVPCRIRLKRNPKEGWR